MCSQSRSVIADSKSHVRLEIMTHCHSSDLSHTGLKSEFLSKTAVCFISFELKGEMSSSEISASSSSPFICSTFVPQFLLEVLSVDWWDAWCDGMAGASYDDYTGFRL